MEQISLFEKKKGKLHYSQIVKYKETELIGEDMQKNVTYILAVIIIIATTFFYKLYASGDLTGIKAAVTKEPPKIETTFEETMVTFSSEANTISIYLCGHVVNPGIYEVLPDTILNDVVTLAGGLTSDAAINRINLVYIIKNNLTIYIPSEEELLNNQYDSSLNVSGIILGNSSINTEDSINTGLININTANKEELTSLPGIGDSTADRIIQYREATPFTKIEDIMNVQGIGESKYNSIKELICV